MTVRDSFWSGLVVMGFALLALTWIIPNYAGTNPFAHMPPDLVPRIACWIMLISGAIVAVGGLVGSVREGQPLVSLSVDWRALGWASWPFFYVAGGIVLLNFFKVTYVGAPLIAAMLILLGERRWYVVLGCSVVPVILLYGLSVYLMRVGIV